MAPYKVLTVDIAPPPGSLADMVNNIGFTGFTVEQGMDVLPAFRRLQPDLLLVGSTIPSTKVDILASIVEQEKEGCPILCITNTEGAGRPVGSKERPNLSFLPKTFEPGELRMAIEALLHDSNDPDQAHLRLLDRVIVGRTPVMQELKRRILRVCKSDLTVLMVGESGTGKEVVARAIHRLSSREDRPFVKVNSAGLPAELFESELFGYKRGAFTGAYQTKPGKFQLAHTGTILLDEIGEIPLPLQAKLLHVLEDREFSALGSTSNTKIDARVLAATNAKLERMVEEQKFRLDLYYRLSVVSLSLPPLRERKEDIDLLCDHFLKKHAPRNQAGGAILPDEVRERFRNHPWPGNVRQLENAIRSVMALGHAEGLAPGPAVRKMKTYTLKEVCKKAVEKAETRAIEEVLFHTGWNRKKAAAVLKTSYRNLLNKIKDYGIEQTESIHPPLGA